MQLVIWEPTKLQNLRDFNDSEVLDALVKTDVISRSAADRATQASTRAKTHIERTLLELGLASEEAVYQVLSEVMQLPLCSLDLLDVSLARSLDLNREYLERVEAVPLFEDETGSIVIATSNPRAKDALPSLSFHLGVPCTAAIARRSTVKAAISAIFENTEATQSQGHGSETDVERLEALTNDGPIIGKVNDLISEAVNLRASDVHVEALDGRARIRLRIDGELCLHRHLSQDECSTYISRLKIMGKLNISEKRRPQDGRAQISVQGRNIDLRLATLPTQHGESLVIRVLDREQIELTWDSLGYTSARVAQIEEIIHMPHGIFLVAGPTGSGKTTTLYTALSQINAENRKIITVEDPIEYAIDGISQVQVQPEIDMTFARALRAILRQDPNVVLIGEIRDQETAEIAVRAALLGRLVLSTVHTNDALSALDRMIDLGVPAYLLGTTLRGVLSQRLIRRLCMKCAGQGCEACDNSGYRGRRVVSELMRVSAASSREIAAMSKDQPLAEDAELRNFAPIENEIDELIAMKETDIAEKVRLAML